MSQRKKGPRTTRGHDTERRPDGRNVPDHTTREPLPLAEIPPTEMHKQTFINVLNSYLRLYRLGECSIIVTKELDRWHISIAHPRRHPTWEEIAGARYRLIPDSACMVMPLPPIATYVNEHPYCFHLVEIQGREAEFVTS